MTTDEMMTLLGQQQTQLARLADAIAQLSHVEYKGFNRGFQTGWWVGAVHADGAFHAECPRCRMEAAMTDPLPVQPWVQLTAQIQAAGVAGAKLTAWMDAFGTLLLNKNVTGAGNAIAKLVSDYQDAMAALQVAMTGLVPVPPP